MKFNNYQYHCISNLFQNYRLLLDYHYPTRIHSYSIKQ